MFRPHEGWLLGIKIHPCDPSALQMNGTQYVNRKPDCSHIARFRCLLLDLTSEALRQQRGLTHTLDDPHEQGQGLLLARAWKILRVPGAALEDIIGQSKLPDSC